MMSELSQAMTHGGLGDSQATRGARHLALLEKHMQGDQVSESSLNYRHEP